MCEHGKGVVFGVGLAQLCRDRPDSVPFVVHHCTAEIEGQSLDVQVRLSVPRGGGGEEPTAKPQEPQSMSSCETRLLPAHIRSGDREERLKAHFSVFMSGVWD